MAEEAQALSVAEHIERGLERYGRGELVAAIVEWESALKLDPSNLRARQYIQYVRENFEALADQFGRVVQSEGGAPPIETRRPTAPGGFKAGDQSAAVDALAAGWDLEEFMPEELPPPPTQGPLPAGIEVAPPVQEWERPPSASDALSDDLAAVAQAVLDPFGLAMTPPQGTQIVEEPVTSGSMEALGVRPLDADPLQQLEPGLDLERTRPHLSSSRLPKTRIPDTAPAEDEKTIDRSEVDTDHARTIERGGFGLRGGDWLRGEGSAPRPTAEKAAGPEDDFSELMDEPPEDLAKTQTKARPLIGETPGRKVTEGPDGGLIVEFVAELPDEYARSSSSEFSVDLGSLEAQELASQLEAEPPTLSRRHTGADTPAIDDSLLGLEPVVDPAVDADGPPASVDRGRRPSFPELEVVAESPPAAFVVTLGPSVEGNPTEKYPALDPAPESTEAAAPPPAAPAEPPPVNPASGPPDVFAIADAPIVAPANTQEPVDVPPPVTRHRSARFDHEYTPLPAPYDPEAVEDEFEEASQKGTTPIPRQPSSPEVPAAPLTGIAGTVQGHLEEARKRFERGELVEAAAAANEAFACDPDGVANAAREADRQLLIRIFETQLGSLKRIPHVAVSPAQIGQLGLDHRFGFMLSLIDGNTSFDDLLDIAGMPRLDAFRILEALLRQGVIRA